MRFEDGARPQGLSLLAFYFHQKFAESGDWTRLGNWWDRRGENELDLIAENELDGRLVIAEVKRDKERVNIGLVRDKFTAFTQATGKFKCAKPEFVALSLEDM